MMKKIFFILGIVFSLSASAQFDEIPAGATGIQLRTIFKDNFDIVADTNAVHRGLIDLNYGWIYDIMNDSLTEHWAQISAILDSLSVHWAAILEAGNAAAYDSAYIHFRVDSLGSIVASISGAGVDTTNLIPTKVFVANNYVPSSSTFDPDTVYATISSMNDSIEAVRADIGTSTGGASTTVTDSLATKLSEAEAQITLLWAAIDSLGGSDYLPLVFSSAELGTYNDSILLLLMSKNAQQDSVPPDSAWTLTENGTEFGIDTTYIHSDSIFIALDSVGLAGATYLLDYTKTFPALQDSSGNVTATWTDNSVTNNIGLGASYSDDFESYSTGSLDGQGNWEVLAQTINVADVGGDNQVTSTGSGQNAWAMYDNTFNDDQYSECTIETVNARDIGVLVRIDDASDSWYAYIVDGTERKLVKRDNGSETPLETVYPGVSDGDEIRIEVEGTTISVYLNGSLDTSFGSGTGQVTDSDLSSGKAGIFMYYNPYIDDWAGGDL